MVFTRITAVGCESCPDDRRHGLNRDSGESPQTGPRFVKALICDGFGYGPSNDHFLPTCLLCCIRILEFGTWVKQKSAIMRKYNMCLSISHILSAPEHDQ